MKTMKYWIAFSLLAGCNAPQAKGQSIPIDQDNQLGATSLAIDRFVDDHGVHVFELRGLDASGEEVALVHLGVGAIDDLLDHVPGDNSYGSELVVSGGTTHLRFLSRETEVFYVHPVPDPAFQGFLTLDAVSSTLRGEANITVPPPPSEASYFSGTNVSCPAAYLNVTPLAKQCCYESNYSGLSPEVAFIIPSNAKKNANALAYKIRNPNNGAPCKGPDGTSACSGDGCTYGPNGFAAASVAIPNTPSAPGSTYYWPPYFWIDNGSYYLAMCAGEGWTTTPPAPIWPDVTGTFANSQGCPVSGQRTASVKWDVAN